MRGTLVKKNGKVLGVEVNGVLMAGGEDEKGLYIEAICLKCNRPFRSYLFGKGPIRGICDECKTRKGSARVEGDTLVIGRTRVKVKVLKPEE